MLQKICAVWFLSFIIILGYELLHHIVINKRRLPHVFVKLREVLLLFSGIFYYVSSAFLGAFSALFLLKPMTIMQGRVEAATGILVGIWILALFLQLVLNLERRLLKAPVQPIVYFNTGIFWWRQKKGGGE